MMLRKWGAQSPAALAAAKHPRVGAPAGASAAAAAGAGASGAPPARRVGRAAAEQEDAAPGPGDPGPTAAVEHASPPADAVRQPSVAAAAAAAAIVPEAVAARAAAPDAARAAAPAAIPERDALARAFPASLARSGATSGRDPVQDAERKVDQAREAYDAAQADPKASAGMKFHLYGKMQEAVLALSKGCPHNLEQQVVEGALQNPPAEAGICADAIRV